MEINELLRPLLNLKYKQIIMDDLYSQGQIQHNLRYFKIKAFCSFSSLRGIKLYTEF